MPKPPTDQKADSRPGRRGAAYALSRRLTADLPNQVDLHVGNRLRIRRTLKGLTQDELASAVGITFQQVQKYEKGANRISASRLYAFSQVLNVRVGWFFEDLEDQVLPIPEPVTVDDDALEEAQLLETREALELIGAYWRITSPAKREALLQLIYRVSA